MALCERCDCAISLQPGQAIVRANEYGEFICDSCEHSSNPGDRPMIDAFLYFVECDFGRHGKSFVETDRDKNSRKQVIANIAAGEYRGPVITVLECNPVERTCRDVTAELIAEAEAEMLEDA